MCDAGDNLTPAAQDIVGRILGELAEGVARMYGADLADVVIGPVDLGAPGDGRA